jgi:hypothetical protein
VSTPEVVVVAQRVVFTSLTCRVARGVLPFQLSTMQQQQIEVEVLEGEDEESNDSICRGTSSKLVAGVDGDGVEDGGRY